ncbi:unnamed protein product [Lepidochelys olivacea]
MHVNKMWDKMPNKDIIILYEEDILISTKSKEDNLEILDQVLQKIKETGFKVSPEKAQICQQVNYLGITLGQERRSTDKQRVELLQKLPGPTDVPTLRLFLGMTNFSRDFIEDYAEKLVHCVSY